MVSACHPLFVSSRRLFSPVRELFLSAANSTQVSHQQTAVFGAGQQFRSQCACSFVSGAHRFNQFPSRTCFSPVVPVQTAQEKKDWVRSYALCF